MRETHLWRDLSDALRVLRRNPGYTATVVLTLGFGIGVCAAVFSIASALLLRPMRFPDPGALVHVWGTDERQGWNRLYVSPPDLEDMRRAVPAFQRVAGFNVREFNLSGHGGSPELVSGARVTGDVFPVLGVAPAIGRAIEPGDVGGPPVAVISDGLWRRFGGDPRILGRTLLVHSQPHTIVGVMPPGFAFPMPVTGVWVPAQPTPEQNRRDNALFQVVGRLRPGSGAEEARGQLGALAARLAAEHPDSHRDTRFDVVPL
ncbi:MAG TPA: ABC transporter permease, partial [Longimicrobium sp.]|nr:ABC transporter permease [Longimicrobium sp.]